MFRKRLVRAYVLVLLVFIAAPVYAPPTFESGATYYSDYFYTWVGAEAQDCNGSYSAWGTLDGPYKFG